MSKLNAKTAATIPTVDSELVKWEARRLYQLGFAIHWLKRNSKRPVETKWTTGPRKEWEQLKQTYRASFNVGVRLGSPSKLSDGTYLAVIDCDVKSAKPEHLSEMREKLRELHSDLGCSVLSGRGNGSLHLYVRTKAPTEPQRFAQSSVKVRVVMPSVEATKFERETLDSRDVDAGVRLRPAWEISIMGERQQVVLPPSLHPDTGRAYVWSVPFESVSELPLMNFKAASSEKALDVVEDFEAEEVDLVSSDLDSRVVDLILSGEGCEDRSASLFTAAMSMLRAGFTTNQVLSVLTDRSTYLGEAAFEHAQTNSRKRAAAWVFKYTLAKARKETLATEQFNEEVESEKLSEEEAKEQKRELLPERTEHGKLERTGGEDSRPKNTFLNVLYILQTVGGASCFKRDEFANAEHYGNDTAWGGVKGREVTDMDVTLIKKFIAQHYRFEPQSNIIHEAITFVAHANRYHPVRDFIGALEWDGVPRLNTWLQRYLGAVGPQVYLEAVSRKVLCAMIARVYRPGCKFDHVLILEGAQGVGKSTAIRALADPWFSDAHISIGDKDAVLTMRSVWVMELGELAGMRKADTDQLKEFVSQQTDRIRNPYGRRAENFPRQCIFIGSTNSGEYLKDTTGNRRFWPVSVGGCDFESLRRDRDQLLAEAKFAHDLGEPLYLEDADMVIEATAEQEHRTIQDPWVAQLDAFLTSEQEHFDVTRFAIEDLFGDWGAFPTVTPDRSHTMRAAEALRLMGYKKERKRSGGTRKVYWVLTKGLTTPQGMAATPKTAQGVATKSKQKMAGGF